MADTTVKYFASTMSGAPALSNTAGSLIGVLDACLVNGFGSVTLNSLVIASNVATGTVSGGHNFAMVGNTGPVIKIEGATPSDLNGLWRIASVPGSTTFTFATTGISDQTATGTITAKRAPAGFSKAFSGTNLAAYRSDDVAGTRLYLRVDDTTTTYARIRGYETMSDVNTGTGPFPTVAQNSTGGYAVKADGTNRPWTLFCDTQMIYVFCDYGNNATWVGGFCFGDIDSYVASDAFRCLLIHDSSTSTGFYLYALSANSYSYLARSYTQRGGSIASARYSHGKTAGLGTGGELYPCVADDSLHLWPVECWDSTSNARGMMPGLWNPIHADTPHGLIVDNVQNLPGRTLIVQTTNSVTYKCVIDITGPWR